jgi:hypothetical protein
MKTHSRETTIPAEVLVNPHLLAASLAKYCNAVFSGDKAHCLAIAEQIMDAHVPEVRALDRIGYDAATNCYVFPHFAILPDGKCIFPGENGFFDLGARVFVQPFARPGTIKPRLGLKPADVHALLCRAWGDRAAVAMAWTISAWFVHPIKARIGFHPFVTQSGDPQTGKTRLTRALNATQALDEEGTPTRRVNTSKGELRKLTQYSGLVAAILEFVPGNSKFDLDQVLTLFNGNTVQVRAQTSNDNRIAEIRFDGALMFVANLEPFTTRPQRERAISLPFKADQITPETAEAVHRIDTEPNDELAGFFVQVMAKRQEIEVGWFDEYEACKREMHCLGITARLVETHSLAWAFHRLFCRLFGVEYDLKPYLFEIAARKHRICVSRDETPADVFLGLLDEIKGGDASASDFLKVDESQGQIAVNLVGAIQRIEKDRGTQIYFSSIDKLQQSLREHPAYVAANRPTRFKARDGRSIQKRAWIFDIGRLTDE